MGKPIVKCSKCGWRSDARPMSLASIITDFNRNQTCPLAGCDGKLKLMKKEGRR